jgi:hypothetical protein
VADVYRPGLEGLEQEDRWSLLASCYSERGSWLSGRPCSPSKEKIKGRKTSDVSNVDLWLPHIQVIQIHTHTHTHTHTHLKRKEEKREEREREGE